MIPAIEHILQLPSKIVVHHSATHDGPEFSWAAIRAYHKSLGWLDIGYHGGAELIGGTEEILIGRPWDTIGAHCLGHNRNSLGVCFVGDFNAAPPTDAKLAAGAALIRLWMRLFKIPAENIFRHDELNDTDCPGRHFDMNRLKEYLT
jgi:N-acetylmuramoyl-L-alanine amidase